MRLHFTSVWLTFANAAFLAAAPAPALCADVPAPASSGIVYSGPLSITLSAAHLDYLGFDFDGDGFEDAYIEGYQFVDQSFVNNEFYVYGADGRFDYVHPTNPTSASWLVRRFFVGETIDSARMYSYSETGYLFGTYDSETQWREGSRGFVGFRFRDLEDETYYGWFDVEVDAGGENLIIHGWAYQSMPDTAIAAGDTGDGVPPPPEVSIADLRLYFELNRTVGASGGSWVLFPFLETTDAGWTFPVTVSSPTESFRGYLNDPEGISASSLVLNTLAEVITRLNGTWTVQFDFPGGQQVTFSFPLEAEGFNAGEVLDFAVLKPTEGTTYPAAGFTLNWSLPHSGSWQSIHAVVSSVDRSGSFPTFTHVLNRFLGPEVTTVVPDVPLPTGEMRLRLSFRNNAATMPGIVVGAPVDEASDPAPFSWSVGPHSIVTRREVFFFLSDDTAPTPWKTWRSANFTAEQLADPAVSGLLAMPAGDGLTNLEKYAFGLGAFEFDVARLPRIEPIPPANPGDPTHARFLFSLVPDDSALEFRPELTHDLAFWRYNGDGQGGPVFDIVITPNGAGGIDVVATTVDPAPPGLLGMRLRLFHPGL
jgi:hypothetical protein